MNQIRQLTQEEGWEFIDIMTAFSKWRVKTRDALLPYEKDTLALLDGHFTLVFNSMKQRVEPLPEVKK